MRVLEVVEAMEGAPEMVDCVKGEGVCAFAQRCRISPFWLGINEDIRRMLAAQTLADLQEADRLARQNAGHD